MFTQTSPTESASKHNITTYPQKIKTSKAVIGLDIVEVPHYSEDYWPVPTQAVKKLVRERNNYTCQICGEWCHEHAIIEGEAKEVPPPVQTPPKPTQTHQDSKPDVQPPAPDKKVIEKPKRNPESILKIPELQKALKEDFGLDDKQQLAALNIKYWSDLIFKPSEAYKIVADSRPD